MKLFDKVIIVNPDADTTGVGFLFGVREEDKIEVVKERAAEEDLRNPRVLCIEAGGDGEVYLLNFDHHAKPSLPSATYQARQYLHSQGKALSLTTERIVSYIHLLDHKSFKERGWKKPNFFSSLVNVWSGMAIFTPDLRERFLKGIGIFREVEKLGIDPFGQMPIREVPAWQRYIDVKRWANGNTESSAKKDTRWSTTQKGQLLAVHEGTIGAAISTLVYQGAKVVVHYNPQKGKFTLEGREIRSLLPILNAKENGWGGQGRLIASPRGKPSSLALDEVVEIVKRNL